jgi:hypothetical protein
MAAAAPLASRVPGVRASLLVFAVAAPLLLCTLATYWRLPPEELYHTTIAAGPAAGFSRVVVSLNFPYALIALTALLPAADRLLSAASRGRRTPDAVRRSLALACLRPVSYWERFRTAVALFVLFSPPAER